MTNDKTPPDADMDISKMAMASLRRRIPWLSTIVATMIFLVSVSDWLMNGFDTFNKIARFFSEPVSENQSEYEIVNQIDIYFDYDKTIMGPDSVAQLYDVARVLDAPIGNRVVLVGFLGADTNGEGNLLSVNETKRMVDARLENIVQFLKRLGVNDEKITKLYDSPYITGRDPSARKVILVIKRQKY